MSAQLGAVLNLIWMMVMNSLYTALATRINDLENHRTETQHEDKLIIKIFVFQFINSYFALVYLAFIKVSRHRPPLSYLP